MLCGEACRRLLSLGPSYAIEREPKRYTNELIVETEIAIRQINPKLQNIYRHLAAKQIKHILKTVDMPLHTIQHAKRMNVCCRITTLEDSNFNQDQKAPDDDQLMIETCWSDLKVLVCDI
jgi:hypothetical protein